MGAGRGIARRASANARLWAGVRVDMSKWEAFVAEQQIDSKPIVDYYLRTAPLAKGRITPSLTTKVLREIFRDFIALGVLTVPLGRGVDDYELTVWAGFDGNDVARDVIRLRNRENGRKEDLMTHLRGPLFLRQTKMSDVVIREILNVLQLELTRIGSDA